MARRDVLRGLMAGDAAPPPEAAAEADPPPAGSPPPSARPARGAIGAVSRSIADLRARAVIEIDPALIEAGGLADRLEADEAADRSLRDSIAAHGQQVPVLVRPHPQKDGVFQIVYGRRRVLALRDLGRPVKALVRNLDDVGLILAQGQENSARRDLSFIEKVNFARQMEAAGYDRKVIGDALAIDKTLVSRMLTVAERVPPEVIAMIGAAPSVGRERWLGLADRLRETETPEDELAGMIALLAASARSDDRFQAAWDYLDRQRSGRTVVPPRAQARATSRAANRTVTAADGTLIAEVATDRRSCTLRLPRNRSDGFEADGFEDWLVRSLPDLFSAWRARQATSDDPANQPEGGTAR